MTTTVDTNNWDAVYATHFSTLNQSIASQWKTINMQLTETDESTGSPLKYVLNATFAPWQLGLGGDGKNVHFTCPIQSGSLSWEKPDKTVVKKAFPTTGALTTIVIEVGMEWVPDPSQQFFATSDKSTVDTVVAALDSKTTVPDALAKLFTENKITLDSSAKVDIVTSGSEWAITDKDQSFYVLYAKQLDDNKKVETEFLYVYKFGKQWQANLILMESDIATGGSAVTVTNILNSPFDSQTEKLPALLFQDLVSDWFNDNLGDFTQIFAQANIAITLDQTSSYKWLTPTATSYAVADSNTFDNGVFGMLMMTGGRAGLSNHQVSPNAIPDKCDAAFIISGPRFVQDMLLAGAMQIFGIKDSDYFTIANNGMSVQNAKDIAWGPFITTDKPDSTLDSSCSTKLDNSDLSDIKSRLSLSGNATIKVMAKGIQWLIADGDTKYIIQVETGDLGVYKGALITIPANQFSMTLDNDKVTMKLVNFSYPYTSDFNVNVTYEESWTLGLKEVKGQKIFWFTQVSPPKMTTTVTKTKAAITREIIEGAIAGALALIAVIGPIVEGLTATVDVTETMNEMGEVEEAMATVNPSREEFQNLMKQWETLQAQYEADIAEFQSLGRLTKIGNTVSSAKWIGVGTLCATFGAIVGIDVAVDKIIESIAGDSPQQKLPNFDAFAEFCIAPYSWSGMSGFDLVSANLANSLVIGLKAKQKS